MTRKPIKRPLDLAKKFKVTNRGIVRPGGASGWHIKDGTHWSKYHGCSGGLAHPADAVIHKMKRFK